jgi:hypothetical protein
MGQIQRPSKELKMLQLNAFPASLFTWSLVSLSLAHAPSLVSAQTLNQPPIRTEYRAPVRTQNDVPNRAASGTGNGGSYSGPNLGGSSVPVGADKTFTLAKVMQATESCLFDLAASVWEQSYRQSFTRAREFEQGREPRDSFSTSRILEPKRVHEFRFSPNSCEYQIAVSVTGATNNDYVAIFANRCTRGSENLAVVRVAFLGELIEMEIPGGLPYLRSLGAISDKIYDEFGRLDLEKVGNTSLPVELVLHAPGERVRLVNRATRAAANLGVDVKGYSQCLRSQLN